MTGDHRRLYLGGGGSRTTEFICMSYIYHAHFFKQERQRYKAGYYCVRKSYRKHIFLHAMPGFGYRGSREGSPDMLTEVHV